MAHTGTSTVDGDTEHLQASIETKISKFLFLVKNAAGNFLKNQFDWNGLSFKYLSLPNCFFQLFLFTDNTAKKCLVKMSISAWSLQFQGSLSKSIV